MRNLKVEVVKFKSFDDLNDDIDGIVVGEVKCSWELRKQDKQKGIFGYRGSYGNLLNYWRLMELFTQQERLNAGLEDYDNV